jgi:hypothetical protein
VGSYFENYMSIPNFWATFSTARVMRKFRQKVGWAIVLQILSQTHLVTLKVIE